MRKIGFLLACIGFMTVRPVYALSVEQLNDKLNGNDNVTVIDIRINALYRQGHIPGAINIPASLVEKKRLPSLGHVVVYSDGITDEGLDEAIASLNDKPGISAEELDGGFSRWVSLKDSVGDRQGLLLSQAKAITYKQLQKMTLRGKQVILVDLRTEKGQESLETHFPNTRIFKPAIEHVEGATSQSIKTQIMAEIPKRNRSVLVLIDDGNGVSEEVESKLHAAETKRVAILTGGQQALIAKGHSVTTVTNSGE
jgi:rhodanese-related sulfurtransferase